MSDQEFIIELVRTLAWPAVAVTLIVILANIGKLILSSELPAASAGESDAANVKPTVGRIQQPNVQIRPATATKTDAPPSHR
jgi:hypothetical protein